MYVPKAFAEHDLAALDQLLGRDSFVTLVTHDGDRPQATHLPVLYARDRARIVIEGHWAGHNPQATHTGTALMIVHGPHAYVSPGWYVDTVEKSRVPTWDYAAAHLYGELARIDDREALASIVERLGRQHEDAVGGHWRLQRDLESHMAQLAGIIGFAFVPDRIEMAFKLHQNHPPANVARTAAGLRAQGTPMAAEVADLLLDRLSRRGQD